MPNLLADTNTCDQLKQWNLCNEQWVLNAKYCRATCGACNGPPPPPAPPPAPPPPPQPAVLSAGFNTPGDDGYDIWINNNGSAGFPRVGR